jgi:hypothetical protein
MDLHPLLRISVSTVTNCTYLYSTLLYSNLLYSTLIYFTLLYSTLMYCVNLTFLCFDAKYRRVAICKTSIEF